MRFPAEAGLLGKFRSLFGSLSDVGQLAYNSSQSGHKPWHA